MHFALSNCGIFRSMLVVLKRHRFLLSIHPAFHPSSLCLIFQFQGHTPFALGHFDQWTRFLTKRLFNCITGARGKGGNSFSFFVQWHTEDMF